LDEETDDDLIQEFLNSQGGVDLDSFNSAEVEDEPKNVDQSPELVNPPLNPSFPAKPLSKPNKNDNKDVITEEAPCECVKYFLCNVDNGTVITDGNVLGLIDIRLGGSKQSPCPHYFDICCKVSKKY